MADGLVAAVAAMGLEAEGPPLPIQSKIYPNFSNQEDTLLRCDEPEVQQEVDSYDFYTPQVDLINDWKRRIRADLRNNPFVERMLLNSPGYAQLLRNALVPEEWVISPKIIYLVGKKGVGKSFFLSKLIGEVINDKEFELLLGFAGTTLCRHDITMRHQMGPNSFKININPIKEDEIDRKTKLYWERRLKEDEEIETIRAFNNVCQQIPVERPAVTPPPLARGDEYQPPAGLISLREFLKERLVSYENRNPENPLLPEFNNADELNETLRNINHMHENYKGPFPKSVSITISSSTILYFRDVTIVDTQGLSGNPENNNHERVNLIGTAPNAMTIFCTEMTNIGDPILNSLADRLNSEVLSRFGVLLLHKDRNARVTRQVGPILPRGEEKTLTNCKVFIERNKIQTFQRVARTVDGHTALPTLALNSEDDKDLRSSLKWLGRLLLHHQISELTTLYRIINDVTERHWSAAKKLFIETCVQKFNFHETLMKNLRTSSIYQTVYWATVQAMIVRAGHWHNMDVYSATRNAYHNTVVEVIEGTFSLLNKRPDLTNSFPPGFFNSVFVPMAKRKLYDSLGKLDLTEKMRRDRYFWDKLMDEAQKAGDGAVRRVEDHFTRWFLLNRISQDELVQRFEDLLKSQN